MQSGDDTPMHWEAICMYTVGLALIVKAVNKHEDLERSLIGIEANLLVNKK